MGQYSFQEVMREWVRSRKAINENKLSCCPLETFTDDYIANIEKEVMAWAAEHPEPVYPTWGEWMLSIGAARRMPTGIPYQLANGEIIDPPYETVVNLYDTIPADIAEKLGIEPKEG